MMYLRGYFYVITVNMGVNYFLNTIITYFVWYLRAYLITHAINKLYISEPYFNRFVS